VYGLVAPVWEQAQVLADRLSGGRPEARYEGSKIATRLKVMGVDLTVMGAREVGPGDEEVAFVNAARGIYQKVVLRSGQVAGAILLGDAAAAPGVLQAFDRGLAAPENRAELLFPSLGEARPPGPLELPPETRLCKCNGVSKGRILEALHDGHRTIDAICRATRAGTGCGSCRRDVQRLMDAFADAPQRRARVA
jgi:nitrite reductase (NADH) large subunit